MALALSLISGGNLISYTSNSNFSRCGPFAAMWSSEIKPIDYSRSCYFVFLLTISHDRRNVWTSVMSMGSLGRDFFWVLGIIVIQLILLSCFSAFLGNEQLRSHKRPATSWRTMIVMISRRRHESRPLNDLQLECDASRCWVSSCRN